MEIIIIEINLFFLEPRILNYFVVTARLPLSTL